MSMRLEEMNEREGFMKTALQTVDLRLSQLEELSGRVAGALEALAGIDRSELEPARSRAPSEGEATFLPRQGSVHSADSAGGGYHFHLPAEELGCRGDASLCRPPASGFGNKRACSFRGKEEKDPGVQLVPGGQGGLCLSTGRSAPASPGGSRLALDSVEAPPPSSSELKSGPGVGVCAGGDGRRADWERGKEETQGLHAEQTSDLQKAQLPVAATAAAVPWPPGGTSRPRSGPHEALEACRTLTSASVVYSHGRRLVAGGGGPGSEWTEEWKYQVHRITRSRSTDLPPCAVSEAVRPAEARRDPPGGPEEAPGAARGAPWPPRPSLAVAERMETGNLLTVGTGRVPGFPSLRSKSLHGRPGRAPGARAGLGPPGHAGSVGSLAVAASGMKTEAEAREKTPTETAC